MFGRIGRRLGRGVLGMLRETGHEGVLLLKLVGAASTAVALVVVLDALFSPDGSGRERGR